MPRFKHMYVCLVTFSGASDVLMVILRVWCLPRQHNGRGEYRVDIFDRNFVYSILKAVECSAPMKIPKFAYLGGLRNQGQMSRPEAHYCLPNTLMGYCQSHNPKMNGIRATGARNMRAPSLQGKFRRPER